MDLTFHVPMLYCSLQHQTWLPSPVITTAGCCFHFGSISSFFLVLQLHWSPVAYWAPINLGSSSFRVISFGLFILFMGFSRQEYWNGLPLPSPVTFKSSSKSIIPQHRIKIKLKKKKQRVSLYSVMCALLDLSAFSKLELYSFSYKAEWVLEKSIG